MANNWLKNVVADTLVEIVVSILYELPLRFMILWVRDYIYGNNKSRYVIAVFIWHPEKIQWQIQDISDEEEGKANFFSILPENCIKMKEIEPRGSTGEA